MMITGGGVYRVLEPMPLITSALADAGWATARLTAPETIKELYAGLASALGFPGYFGHNLDALWDCLTDLTGPTALIMESWTRPAVAEPERWQSIMDVLSQRTELEPPFAVILA